MSSTTSLFLCSHSVGSEADPSKQQTLGQLPTHEEEKSHNALSKRVASGNTQRYSLVKIMSFCVHNEMQKCRNPNCSQFKDRRKMKRGGSFQLQGLRGMSSRRNSEFKLRTEKRMMTSYVMSFCLGGRWMFLTTHFTIHSMPSLTPSLYQINNKAWVSLQHFVFPLNKSINVRKHLTVVTSRWRTSLIYEDNRGNILLQSLFSLAVHTFMCCSMLLLCPSFHLLFPPQSQTGIKYYIN